MSVRDEIGDAVKKVIDDPLLRDYFFRFLKEKAHTEEHLQFYVEAQKYKTLTDLVEKLDVMTNIVSTFIVLTSKNRINVSEAVRDGILKVMDEVNAGDFDQVKDEVFDEASFFVFILLRDDCFPKFQSSSYYIDMMKHHENNVDETTSLPEPTKQRATTVMVPVAPALIAPAAPIGTSSMKVPPTIKASGINLRSSDSHIDTRSIKNNQLPSGSTSTPSSTSDPSPSPRSEEKKKFRIFGVKHRSPSKT